MTQPRGSQPSPLERRKELPPVGAFGLEQVHLRGETAERNFVVCLSAKSPIELSIQYILGKGPGGESRSDEPEPEGFYHLRWPTSLIRDEVVDLVRLVGGRQTAPAGDLAYVCQETAVGGAEAPKLQTDANLDKILVDDFDTVGFLSSNLSLIYRANEDTVQTVGTPAFNINSPHHLPLDSGVIPDLVSRTIAHRTASDIGALAALQDLQLAFDAYKSGPPEPLFT